MNFLISKTDLSAVNKLIKCTRNGCNGSVGVPKNMSGRAQWAGTSLRAARAVIEYGLSQNPSFRLGLECSDCGGTNWYTYSDIINLIPEHLRPKELPDGQADALILIGAGEADGHDCFFGERVLVQISDELGNAWNGQLLTTSSFTPTLQPGIEVCGFKTGVFRVCNKYLNGTTLMSLPAALQGPGTSDHGVFVLGPSNSDVLLATEPFCSNPSCCHIIRKNHTQFLEAQESAEESTWFWNVDTTLLVVHCNRCGTCTALTSSSYDGLKKI